MNSIEELTTAVEEMFSGSGSIKIITPVLEQYIGDDWKNFCDFSSDDFQRIILTKNKFFEIVLICWSAYQGSPLHNHPAQGCIMKVLQGSLEEELYRLDPVEFLNSKELGRGNIGYIHDSIAIHKLYNAQNTEAVSLHVYAPPDYKPKEFYCSQNRLG